MHRKTFIKNLAFTPLIFSAMSLTDLFKTAQTLNSTALMPVLFLGHGSPMNAIEENEFVAGFRRIAATLPKPNAIVCISAHWETRGTQVTAMPQPQTIHDFGGFPPALYQVQYPAKGSPELATDIKNLITLTEVELDQKWGLDHGAWSVIKHLYPNADVPVVQLSLDYFKTPQAHYELGQQLLALRKKGILIIGSGNLVHNLRLVAWDKFSIDNYAYDWALEANTRIKALIRDNNHPALIGINKAGKAFEQAIPTPEHYLPLLYVLALQQKNETISFFNDKAVAGSLTMTSVKIG
jgi:4,5-DOPA dioxygenase extradiol